MPREPVPTIASFVFEEVTLPFFPVNEYSGSAEVAPTIIAPLPINFRLLILFAIVILIVVSGKTLTFCNINELIFV